VRDADVVLDCSDNFATRHALNRACVAHYSRSKANTPTCGARSWAYSRRWWGLSARCRPPKR
jgi:molybdopterin/thiamine biosynthesis adenylyltransferase